MTTRGVVRGWGVTFLDSLQGMAANRMTLVAMIVVAFLVVIAVFAPLLAPYSPIAINLAERLQPVSGAHWFGTDEVGRDILSRIIYGARISIGASLVVVVVAGIVGMILGAIAGFLGGWVDSIIMRAADVTLSFPSLILAIALAAALGPSLANAVLAITITKLPIYVRLGYAQTQTVRQELYIKAARTFGTGNWGIIRRHILPNIRSAILVQTMLDFGDAILLISTLGFLGLGAQPPTPEWGAMISTGWHYLIDQWWYPTFTGAAIFLAVMSFNLLGDGIREMFAPTARD